MPGKSCGITGDSWWRAAALEWVGFFSSRLRRHVPGYAAEFAPYLVLLGIAAAADFVTTCSFMTIGSVEDEAHPAIRLISLWFGPFFGPLLGKTIQAGATIFLTLLLRPHARKIFIPVILSYSAAAVYNGWATCSW
jgi:hypothetical protein